MELEEVTEQCYENLARRWREGAVMSFGEKITLLGHAQMNRNYLMMQQINNHLNEELRG
jgi:hypothetical protein